MNKAMIFASFHPGKEVTEGSLIGGMGSDSGARETGFRRRKRAGVFGGTRRRQRSGDRLSTAG
ncbi:MAG: hypothetical protein HRU41_05135 [Saprospiraceae bacterium]|nr:hypothetical protein [Saprospiraceae bacterium]